MLAKINNARIKTITTVFYVNCSELEIRYGSVKFNLGCFVTALPTHKKHT